MGSLLKRNAIIVSFLALAMVFSGALWAAEKSSSEPMDPLIDGYYPTYPPTKPASGAQEELIKRGEYLARVGDCIACHTDVQGKTAAFAGGLPINTPFGTFYSPNITPDKKQELGIGQSKISFVL